MDTDELTITLTFDDGETVDCYVLGTFEVDSNQYVALENMDASVEDIYIYGYNLVDEATEEWELIEIEDEDEFEAAASEFESIMEDEEADDEGDEDINPDTEEKEAPVSGDTDDDEPDDDYDVDPEDVD